MRGGPAGGRRGALGAVLLALAATGCGVEQGPHVEGEAPAVARDTLPVYVSDAAGGPLQRPERFAVSEFASLTSLTWESWGGSEASATGMLSGMWCLPECLEDGGFPATVELSDPVPQERVAYYRSATVHSTGLPPEIAAELTDITLVIPGGGGIGDAPDAPEVPEAPEAPEAPGVPEAPEAPGENGTPGGKETAP